MKILDNYEAQCLAAKQLGKWCIYISFECYWDLAHSGTMSVNTFLEELVKAAPYLSMEKNAQVIIDGNGLIVCDSEDECDTLYWQTVGDDGPRGSNPYNGPVRVYAMTIGPDGQIWNDNT